MEPLKGSTWKAGGLGVPIQLTEQPLGGPGLGIYSQWSGHILLPTHGLMRQPASFTKISAGVVLLRISEQVQIFVLVDM